MVKDYGHLLRNDPKYAERAARIKYCEVMQQHAVAHRRHVDAADVLEADVETALQQRSHLAGQNDRLRTARAGAAAARCGCRSDSR